MANKEIFVSVSYRVYYLGLDAICIIGKIAGKFFSSLLWNTEDE